MNYKFKNLVFEGGGVKGIAYGGALKVLDEMQIIPGIQRVAGTSAGAINACLLSLGYSYQDISRIIAGTQFRSFMDKSWFFPRNVSRIFYKYGYYKGDTFRTWLGDLIKDKTGTKDLTFKELKTLAGANGFKELYVIATNLSEQKAEVLSHETYADLSVCEAVRMSMSIPFFFKASKYNTNVMVDGGVSWNYPLNIFDYKEYLINQSNGTAAAYSADSDYVFNNETLGLRLDSTAVIDYEKHNWALPPMKITSIRQHTAALLNFMMEKANNSHLHQNDWNRTIAIDTLGVKTTQFNLGEKDISQLIASGEKSTGDYFKWRNNDAKWSLVPA
jgi:NTE family protein